MPRTSAACLPRRYCTSVGEPPGAEMRKPTIEDRLASWAGWAEGEEELTAAEVAMCDGPDHEPMAHISDRAELAGVKFACYRVVRKARGKNCVVAVRAEGGLWVGQLEAFVQWRAPWQAAGAARVELAYVRWYRSLGTNAGLLGAPVVSRKFARKPSSSLCLAQEILPASVCLVPHIQLQGAWQVLFPYALPDY